MKILNPTPKIIEGNITDHQFCAEKIFAYGAAIGLPCHRVRVRATGFQRQVIISLEASEPSGDGDVKNYSDYSDSGTIEGIIADGYLLAARAFSSFFVKN